MIDTENYGDDTPEPKKKIKLSPEEYEERQEFVQILKDKYLNHPLRGEEQLRRAYYKAWYDGYHYLDIKYQLNKLQKEELPKSQKHRSKINYIKTNTNISVAKIMKDQPTLNAIPMGGNMKDIKAARVANAILQNAFAQNEIDLTSKTYDVMKLANIYGTGWWKIKWNPLLMGGLGNYEVTVHDDFEIYPGNGRDWWSMEDCMHAYMQDVKILERIYPDLKGKITAWQQDENAQNRAIYSPDNYSNHPQSIKGKAFVLEYTARAGGRWTEGKKAVLINMTELAEYRDNPFAKFGDYFSMNYVPFVWWSVNGMIHGASAVSDQIPINKEINKICSMTMENIRKTAAIKWFVPRGSGTKQQDIDGNTNFIQFNPDQGGKPIAATPPSMPSYVPNHLSYLVGTQQDMAGIHEVSMGQLPERGSQMSGSALKLLQDSEMVQHSPVMRRLKSSLSIAGQLILKIAQEYYKEKRFITIVGEHKRHEVLEFMGADLDGAFDLKLEIGSAINTSAAAKIEAILALWKEGVLQEAEKGSKAAKKVLSSLEFGQIDEIYQLESLDFARAQWSLDTILNTYQVPDVYPWENQDAYIQVLKEYMLTPDFMEQTDQLKGILEDRMNYHLQAKAQQPQQGGQPPQQGQEAMPMQSQQAESNQMLAEGPGNIGDQQVQFPEEGMPNA